MCNLMVKMQKEHVWKGDTEINTSVLICYSLDVHLLGIHMERVSVYWLYEHGAQGRN